MYNAAPTPHTDIRGTMSCMHVVRTTCAIVSCAHVNIILEKEIYASRVIYPARFKLPSKMLLPVIMFEGGIANNASVAAKSSLPMCVALSFVSVFPRALEVGLFLGVVVSLSDFGGSEISAQSEPDDKRPPPPRPRVLPPQVRLSSVQPSTADPPRSNPHTGGCVLLQPLVPTPGLHSLVITSAPQAYMFDTIRGGTVLARLVSSTGGMSSSTFELCYLLSCPCFKLETLAFVKVFTLEFRVAKLETIASDKALTLEFRVAISTLRAVKSKRVCPHFETFTSNV